MSKYIGFLNCPNCGYKHVTDVKTVKIYYAMDAKEQICSIKCPGCDHTEVARIRNEDLVAFRTHGVNPTPLSEFYEPLTEDAIAIWDPQKEFRDGFQHLI